MVDFDAFKVNEKMLLTNVFDSDDEFCEIKVNPNTDDVLVLGESFLDQYAVIFDTNKQMVALGPHENYEEDSDDSDLRPNTI